MDENTSLEAYNNYSLSEIADLIYHLKALYKDKHWSLYKTITIYNSNGNITSKIKKEYAFCDCWHERSIDGTIGANHVGIPKSKYSKELEDQIKSKFNDID